MKFWPFWKWKRSKMTANLTKNGHSRTIASRQSRIYHEKMFLLNDHYFIQKQNFWGLKNRKNAKINATAKTSFNLATQYLFIANNYLRDFYILKDISEIFHNEQTKKILTKLFFQILRSKISFLLENYSKIVLLRFNLRFLVASRLLRNVPS